MPCVFASFCMQADSKRVGTEAGQDPCSRSSHGWGCSQPRDLPTGALWVVVVDSRKGAPTETSTNSSCGPYDQARRFGVLVSSLELS